MKKTQTTWDEWHQRYQRFPGVDYCVERLKHHNTKGELLDLVINVLEASAAEYAEDLLDAADKPDNGNIRRFLLMAIENAALEVAVPFWAQILSGPDDEERMYAERALALIDTNDARRFLWESRSQ